MIDTIFQIVVLLVGYSVGLFYAGWWLCDKLHPRASLECPEHPVEIIRAEHEAYLWRQYWLTHQDKLLQEYEYGKDIEL